MMFWIYLYAGIGITLAFAFDILLIWMLIKNEIDNKRLGGNEDYSLHEILGVVGLLVGGFILMTLGWLLVVSFLIYVYSRMIPDLLFIRKHKKDAEMINY
jgi:hypothetical protein